MRKLFTILFCIFAVSTVFGKLERNEFESVTLEVGEDTNAAPSAASLYEHNDPRGSRESLLRVEVAQGNFFDPIAYRKTDTESGGRESNLRNPSLGIDTSTVKANSSKETEKNAELMLLDEVTKRFGKLWESRFTGRNRSTKSKATLKRISVDFLKRLLPRNNVIGRHRMMISGSISRRFLRRKREALIIEDPLNPIESLKVVAQLRMQLPVLLRLKVLNTDEAEEKMVDSYATSKTASVDLIAIYNSAKQAEREQLRATVTAGGPGSADVLSTYKTLRKGVPWNYIKHRGKFKKFFAKPSPALKEYEVLKKEELTLTDGVLYETKEAARRKAVILEDVEELEGEDWEKSAREAPVQTNRDKKCAKGKRGDKGQDDDKDTKGDKSKNKMEDKNKRDDTEGDKGKEKEDEVNKRDDEDYDKDMEGDKGKKKEDEVNKRDNEDYDKDMEGDKGKEKEDAKNKRDKGGDKNKEVTTGLPKSEVDTAKDSGTNDDEYMKLSEVFKEPLKLQLRNTDEAEKVLLLSYIQSDYVSDDLLDDYYAERKKEILLLKTELEEAGKKKSQELLAVYKLIRKGEPWDFQKTGSKEREAFFQKSSAGRTEYETLKKKELEIDKYLDGSKPLEDKAPERDEKSEEDGIQRASAIEENKAKTEEGVEVAGNDPENVEGSQKVQKDILSKLSEWLAGRIAVTNAAEEKLLESYAMSSAASPNLLEDYNEAKAKEREVLKLEMAEGGAQEANLLADYKCLRKGKPWNSLKLQDRFKSFFEKPSASLAAYEELKQDELSIDMFLSGQGGVTVPNANVPGENDNLVTRFVFIKARAKGVVRASVKEVEISGQKARAKESEMDEVIERKVRGKESEVVEEIERKVRDKESEMFEGMKQNDLKKARDTKRKVKVWKLRKAKGIARKVRAKNIKKRNDIERKVRVQERKKAREMRRKVRARKLRKAEYMKRKMRARRFKKARDIARKTRAAESEETEEVERKLRAKETEEEEEDDVDGNIFYIESYDDDVDDDIDDDVHTTPKDVRLEGAQNTVTTTASTSVTGGSNLLKIAILFVAVMQLVNVVLILRPLSKKFTNWCRRMKRTEAKEEAESLCTEITMKSFYSNETQRVNVISSAHNSTVHSVQS